MVEAWRATDGAFDPSILPALIESGYRTSIDDPYRVTFLPDGRLVVGGYDAGPTMDDIVIDPDGSTITLPPGLVIDPGGIGKGLAADLAVRHLLALGAAGALVSIGGDMVMAGSPPHDAAGWTVAVAHPDLATGNLCTLLVGAGGVATSSTRSRRWIHDGANGTIRSTRVEPEQSSTDLAVRDRRRAFGLAGRGARHAALLSGTHDVLGYLDDHELSGIAVALDGNVLSTADLSIRTCRPTARRGSSRPMNPQFWWFLTRASGIVAWLMLTASVIWGIVLSTKAFPEQRRPAWLLDLHRWLGGLTVSFVAIHLAALVADSYVSFGLVDLLVPFASAWKPLRRCDRRGGDVAARRRRGHVAAHEAPPPPDLALDPLVELRGVPARQPARRVRRHRSLALAVPSDRRRIDRRCHVGDGVPPHPSQTRSPRGA